MGTDIHAAAEVFKQGAWHLSDMVIPVDRNYITFAVLADVRNGYGFGGFDSGDRVEPISEPRGLPQDLSAQLRACLAGEGNRHIWLGDSDLSWLTLRELLAYDLDRPCTRRGMVPPEEAERVRREGGAPRTMAAWVADPTWVKLSWSAPLRQEAWLLVEIIDTLLSLGFPDQVRLVFGFDN